MSKGRPPLQVTLNNPNQKSVTLYPFGRNKQYLEIVGSLRRNCFYLLALDACQYTPPGHVIQASLVVRLLVHVMYAMLVMLCLGLVLNT